MFIYLCDYLDEVMRIIKVRLYPTPSQVSLLEQAFEASRKMWNDLLAINKQRYEQEKKFVFFFEMCKEVTRLRKENGLYQNVPRNPLDSSAKQLDIALRQFLKRRKSGFGFPRFRRFGEEPILIFRGDFKVLPQAVHLPRIKDIKIRDKAVKTGAWEFVVMTARQVWVKKEANKYYAYVVYGSKEEPEIEPLQPQEIVGVDVGIEKTITLSDGRVFNLPKEEIRRLVKKAEHLQSIIDKKINANKKFKVKHSNKLRRAIAKEQEIHRKLDRIHTYYYYNIAHEICKDYQYIAVEDLNLSELKQSKNHPGKRRIHKWLDNIALSKFFRTLEWVARKQGSQVIYVNPKDTSKTCSRCGFVNKDLKLSDRKFVCPNCGLEIDRDLNASLNIMRKGLEAIHKPSSVEHTEYTPVKEVVIPLTRVNSS